MHDYKTLLRRAGAVLFWLAVWQAAAMAIGQEVFLVSPVQALRCLLRLLPQADFWHRVGSAPGASCWASGWVHCPVPSWRWRRKNGSGWTPFSPP